LKHHYLDRYEATIDNNRRRLWHVVKQEMLIFEQ
jgi:hypothetical protein